VKVVADKNGRALYFSRSPIPHGVYQQNNNETRFTRGYRHVGVYAFRKEVLLRFTQLERTPLEQSERLEQLRALENGMTIGLVVTNTHTVGVDVPDDIKKVEKELHRIYTDVDWAKKP
jgi:3-deoxy-manno-octulosonate cytidylyltransferase (CMP-KDO synthetase)